MPGKRPVNALLFVISIKYIDYAKRVEVWVTSGCSVTNCLQSWVAKFVLTIMTIVFENLLPHRVIKRNDILVLPWLIYSCLEKLICHSGKICSFFGGSGDGYFLFQ